MKAKLSVAVLLLIGFAQAEKQFGSIKNKPELRTLLQLQDHEVDTDDIVTDWDGLLVQTGDRLRMQTKDHSMDTDDMPEGFDPTFLQTMNKDHDLDTDDIPEGQDPVLLQIKDHEKDTEDIPENLDPTDVHLRDEDGGWYNPDEVQLQLQNKAEEKKRWDAMYAQEEEQASYELVQFNHENDTDDLAEGQEPFNVGQVQLKNMVQTNIERMPQFTGKRIGELVQMNDEEVYDISDVVLMRYTVEHHAQDTDDIVVELNDEKNYDSKHSRKWNSMVEQQTKAIDQQLKDFDKKEEEEEQLKKETEERKQEWMREQAEIRRRNEMIMREKMLKAIPKSKVIETKNPTLDLSEVYRGMLNTDTGDDTKAYRV